MEDLPKTEEYFLNPSLKNIIPLEDGTIIDSGMY